MNQKGEQILIQCLQLLLKPVVSFCIRRSLALQDLIEAARGVFIRAAAHEMQEQGKKVTVSALSILTGMHRKGVVRILEEGESLSSSAKFASRVIGQWRHDKRFCTDAGKPRVLSYGSPDSEFTKLVHAVSTDIYPTGILFDLERVGAIERTKNGVKLLTQSYQTKHDPVEGFQLMARDTEHLMTTIEENIFSNDKSPPHFHGTVIYDNINADEFSKIQKWLFRESVAFQRKVDRFLAKHDLDIHPDSQGKGGRRVVLGIFTRM